MAARTVLSGPSSLRTHLKSVVSSLRRSPCLIISSDLPSDEQQKPNPPPAVKSFRQSISDHCNRAGFTASMELGLRTVNCSVSSAYPTRDDVQRGIDLAKRTGATTVIGVGAGAAVDCAKGVAAALGSSSDSSSVDLILAPATLGSTMSAMSSTPLILSTAEEALLPPYLACASDRKSITPADFAPVKATVCLDGESMGSMDNGVIGGSPKEMSALATPIDAALASLVVCVESSLLLADQTVSSGGDELEAMHNLMEGARSNALATIDAYRNRDDGIAEGSDVQNVARLHAAAAVAHAGQLLRYGDRVDRKRSISVALISSLLPRYFPHGHALTFMASLLPGLCESCSLTNKGAGSGKPIRIGEQTIDDFAAWSEEITAGMDIPKLVNMAEGTPDVDSMMERVDANAALVGCDEIGGYDLIEAVLHRSLNK